MAQQRNFGVSSKMTLAATVVASLFLIGCSRIPLTETVTVTKVEKITVPIAARPKPIDLLDTRIYVVNAANLEEFIAEFTAENGDLAYVALSIKDYENLALNISELRRFINQQTEIIIYYEKALSNDESTSENQSSSKTD